MSGALSSVLVLMSVSALAQTDFYTENPSYNLTGSGAPASGYNGNVGIRFGLQASDVPAGDAVEVTALGFWAGTSGQFTGAGTVDYNHTLSLWVPNTYANRTGSYASLNLASVTLSAGATVDANGFAWVTLSTPITLVPSDYYMVLTSVTSGQTTDPYLNPYDNGSSGNTAITGYAGTPFVDYEGAYSTSGQAYNGSGYLGPNLQYEIVVVPEPSIMALGGIGLMALMVYRRRAVK